ncbi:MAG: AMIN domain-containing protein, partial [Myxococcales bacterium]
MALGRLLTPALLLALALPLAASAQEGLNEITEIRVRAGACPAVEIVGSRRPSFTSFTMANPHRLVIDFADSVFRNVPAQLEGEPAAIESVRTSLHGSDQGSIARVIIRFRSEVETELQAVNGNVLQVQLAGPALVADASAAQKQLEAQRAKEEAARLAEEAQRRREEEEARRAAEAKRREEQARAETEERQRREAEAEQQRLEAQRA